jgi:hypothetical protein
VGAILGVSAMRVRPFTFNIPSILNDSEQAGAAAKTQFEEIVREAVRGFGHQWVREIVLKITKRRRGRKKKSLEATLLDEYDAAAAKAPNGKLIRANFIRDFYKRHQRQAHSKEAVRKLLERGLQARQQKRAENKPLLIRKRSKAIKTVLGQN